MQSYCFYYLVIMFIKELKAILCLILNSWKSLFEKHRYFTIQKMKNVTQLLWSSWFSRKILSLSAVTCRLPRHPVGGSIKTIREPVKPGDEIWFLCNPGYTLVGTKDFVCQNNGKFDSDDFPTCKKRKICKFYFYFFHTIFACFLLHQNSLIVY